MEFGGKGANQAVAAAKLGPEVAIITKLGEDSFGKDTFKNFKSYNINTEKVFFTDEALSGVAPIAVDSEGNNSIIIVTGGNDLLTEDEIETVQSIIANSKILIYQLEIPLNISLRALKIAKKNGVTTIFNPAPAPKKKLPEEIYSLCDFFCPNEPETELLTGIKLTSKEKIY